MDVFLTNCLDVFNCCVAKSVTKSSNCAIYINYAGVETTAPAADATKKRVKCYEQSAADLALLSQFFINCNYNWNGLFRGIDDSTLSVDQAFANFINILHYALEHVVGYRTVIFREYDTLYLKSCHPLKFCLERVTSCFGRVK